VTPEAAPPPVPPRPRLVDDVVTVLRDKICRGELRAGTQLLQQDLASQLGVSRTPLREAFRILENDGLVRMANGNRTIEVVTITPADLTEMYQIREVVDGLAAKLVARRGLSAAALAEARHLLGEMAASVKPYDPARCVGAHAAFHALFVLHSENQALRSYIPLIRTSAAALLYLPFIDDPAAGELVDPGHLVTHLDLLNAAQHSHDGILRAVLSGDARAAEDAARAHTRRTLSAMPDLSDWPRRMTE
jgi:GntR family transcriptional regulator of vanillate catabolism